MAAALPEILAVKPDYTLDPAAVTFQAGGLITVHRCEFLKDKRFKRAYQKALLATGREAHGSNVAWRAHTICWAAQHATKLEGGYVECGVHLGMCSIAAAAYVDFAAMTERKFYLFDTYRGVDLDLLSPAESSKRDKFAQKNARLYGDFYDTTKANFADVPNAVLVRGSVPGTLSSVPIDRVAYLSIDMNCVGPEVEAIRHFWPKLSRGAVIVLDDYGFSGHGEQMRGIDLLGVELGFQVMSLPTGQGLILRW